MIKRRITRSKRIDETAALRKAARLISRKINMLNEEFNSEEPWENSPEDWKEEYGYDLASMTTNPENQKTWGGYLPKKRKGDIDLH